MSLASTPYSFALREDRLCKLISLLLVNNPEGFLPCFMSKELSRAFGHFSSSAELEPREQEGKLVGPGGPRSLFGDSRANVLPEVISY